MINNCETNRSRRQRNQTVHEIGQVDDLVPKRTEKSALALRRLTGAVTLTPKKPDVGRPYFLAACRFESLNLLIEDGGSYLLQWWRRWESTRMHRVHEVDAVQ